MSQNDSPAVREIIKQCMVMLENGHPTAPFLRALAHKIELGEITPPPRRRQSESVVQLRDRQRGD